MIEVTERAATAVAQAETAARRFNPEVCVRLVRADGGVRFEFTDEPSEDDEMVPCEAAVLYVEPGLEGTLDTGDHNAPVLTA
jgi:Fe-S cluster assembly iron-binding protein IscA